MEGVRDRKRKMVESLVRGFLAKDDNAGTEVILGEGRMDGPRTLEVKLNQGGTRRLAADRLFLDLGTHATLPDIPGLAAAKPMTHIEALELDRTPGHLVILGGGYVGVEFAQAMRRFGSRVTVIARGPQLLTREDQDVGEALQQLFRDEGAAGRARSTRDRLVPYCIFTDPELARVGLNESEARQRRIPYRVAKMPASGVFRTLTLSETRGFVKMLIDENSNRILGFTALIAGAGDLMAVVQTAMLGGMPFPALRDAVFAHPTTAEGLIALLADVEVREYARAG
jgi:pyruvate/2-oxoglutarate dehydrogenase complex dihydrolipoamide dehydrogenase (E3) component